MADIIKISEHFKPVDQPKGAFGDRVIARDGHYYISLTPVSYSAPEKYKDRARELLGKIDITSPDAHDQTIDHMTALLNAYVPEYRDAVMQYAKSGGTNATPRVIISIGATIGIDLKIIKLGCKIAAQSYISAPDEEISALAITKYNMPPDNNGESINQFDCYTTSRLGTDLSDDTVMADTLVNALALIFAASEESRLADPENFRSPLDERGVKHYQSWSPDSPAP